MGTGSSRPSLAHNLAIAASADGASAAVQTFASLGRGGVWQQNIERDMHRWLANLHDLGLEPHMVQMRVWDCEHMEETVAAIPVLAPHELLGAMVRKGSAVVRTCLLGSKSPAVVAEYWEQAVRL